MRRATGKPREHRSPRKIDVTGKLAVASVSVVTLIRTDTTLDHSQKAEKVWSTACRRPHYAAANRTRRVQTGTIGSKISETKHLEEILRAARSRRLPLPEIVLWSTASQHPSESQTSECSDLLSRSRATCLIVAQRQPGKLISRIRRHQLCPRTNTATAASLPPFPENIAEIVKNFENIVADPGFDPGTFGL